MEELKVIYKKVSELIPYVNNPRNNTDAVDKVASSIKNFGFKVPIVIDSQNEIITGHTRLLASRKLNIDSVPCIIADDLTEAQIKAYRIADNKVAEYSTWNEELLNIELEELDNLNFDMELTGFDMDDIDMMLDNDEETGEDNNGFDGELDIDSFEDVMELKIKLTKDEYLFARNQLENINDNLTIALLEVLKYEK